MSDGKTELDVGGAVIAPQGTEDPWEMEPGRPATFRIISSDTAGAVAVFEERVPAGAGTPIHIHHTSEELIYVRNGTFRFRTGEESTEVGPGAWVFIPRGLKHAWRNVGSTSGDLSFVFTPADGAQCFEELRKRGRTIPEIPEAELVSTFTKHGYELVSFDWN